MKRTIRPWWPKHHNVGGLANPKSKMVWSHFVEGLVMMRHESFRKMHGSVKR